MAAGGDPGEVRRIDVVDVRVGRPSLLGGTRRGEVTSAIVKQPVDVRSTSELRLGQLNLDGDDQADRSVHGGPDKSVYCYPSEHAAAWHSDGFAFPPGSVGENLVLRGVTEATARIGDIWQWGDALVQISQPRAPCFKLTLHTGRREVAAVMIASGRCGWYLRTLRPGSVPVRGMIELVETEQSYPTVADAFAVMFPNARPDADERATLARVLACPAIAPEWVRYLRARSPRAGDV